MTIITTLAVGKTSTPTYDATMPSYPVQTIAQENSSRFTTPMENKFNYTRGSKTISRRNLKTYHIQLLGRYRDLFRNHPFNNRQRNMKAYQPVVDAMNELFAYCFDKKLSFSMHFDRPSGRYNITTFEHYAYSGEFYLTDLFTQAREKTATVVKAKAEKEKKRKKKK